MDDRVVDQIVEAPNSQLSSEEKSMLVNALLDDPEINNQLSTTSSTAHNAQAAIVQPKEVRDAISYRKEESPPLPSPQEPKAQPCADDKSSLDKNTPPSQNSSAATAASQEVELQGEDSDSKGKMKGDHENLIDDDHGSLQKIEETLSRSSSNGTEKQPKEKIAPGLQLNLNETKKDIRHISSETDFEGTDDDPETDSNARGQKSVLRRSASARVASECTVVSHQVEGQLCVVEVNGGDSINGESANIHKQKAACRECNKLVSDSRAWNVKCKCTATSIIHETCKNRWSQKRGNKCPNCDDQIKTMVVDLRPISSQTTATSPHPTCKRSTWCCFC